MNNKYSLKNSIYDKYENEIGCIKCKDNYYLTNKIYLEKNKNCIEYR